EFKVPSFMGAEQNLSETELSLFRGVPFFEKTDVSRLYISGFGKRKEGVYANLISKDKVNYGGYLYPSGVQVSGENDLLRIYMKGSININGIEICGQLGQHAQTLEIFEIKLCDDLKLPEGVIPAGSVIDFPKGMPKNGIKFSDIRCLLPAKATSLKGRPVKSGVEITPNYEVWQEPDRNCMRGGD
ncbi:MAG: hypothetical protein IT288_03535, partial [Bdellovibrionales bacterium]|nr:hypothetical protein [Bdellovibrionales bacterium]